MGFDRVSRRVAFTIFRLQREAALKSRILAEEGKMRQANFEYEVYEELRDTFEEYTGLNAALRTHIYAVWARMSRMRQLPLEGMPWRPEVWAARKSGKGSTPLY